MGAIINDKTFLNDNIFKFEKRLESQYSIFTEKTPTFVTYYHINSINSVTDTGLLNVDRILGKESPLKYQKIEDFPIYGIDQIKIDLNDEDEGLNGSYEGEGIILPNTIKPLPNDFFIISYLDQRYMFMVTTIDYDTIKSNNYYKITFMLKSTSISAVEKIDSQVLEKYTCIFKNIGTEENCLIQEDAYNKLLELDKIYSDIMKKYIAIFYNKRYNCFLLNTPNNVIYDKFLSNFISRNNIMNEKGQYNTIVLNNEDYGEQFPITYDFSVYRNIESRDKENLKYVKYELCPITYPHSIFIYYNLKNVKSLILTCMGDETYISDDTIDNIKNNIVIDSNGIIDNLLVQYFNNSIESIFQIDLERIRMYNIQYTLNDYIMLPILLFILKHYIEKFLHM